MLEKKLFYYQWLDFLISFSLSYKFWDFQNTHYRDFVVVRSKLQIRAAQSHTELSATFLDTYNPTIGIRIHPCLGVTSSFRGEPYLGGLERPLFRKKLSVLKFWWLSST